MLRTHQEAVTYEGEGGEAIVSAKDKDEEKVNHFFTSSAKW